MNTQDGLFPSLILMPLPLLAGALLAGVLWSTACLWIAAYLKCFRGVRTGYTRKIFHLLTFLTAAALNWRWGLPAVCLFGAATTAVLAYAVYRSDGYPPFEALARESDRPYRTYYVVIPYFATLIGGVVSNVLFGSFATVGYLVGGIGDAAGEPVGTRWGRHGYQVPWFGRRSSIKTLEGSAAVLAVSLVVLLMAVLRNSHNHPAWFSLGAAAGIAVVCTIIEAATPRGWDNTPMQVVPAFLTFLLLRSGS